MTSGLAYGRSVGCAYGRRWQSRAEEIGALTEMNRTRLLILLSVSGAAVGLWMKATQEAALSSYETCMKTWDTAACRSAPNQCGFPPKRVTDGRRYVSPDDYCRNEAHSAPK